MRKIIIMIALFLLVVFSVSGCGTDARRQTGAESPTEAVAGDMTALENNVDRSDTKLADTRDVIEVLTLLPGRVPGSGNNEKAAEWIAGQFEFMELKPLVKEDFFWPYPQTVNGQKALPDNVVGYIKGSDSTRAILVTCHLDAVSGSAGALDNASGVAAMLRTAANISGSENNLKPDIIFCAFNGEEQNYAGSKAFIEDFQGLYESAININFDCVGMIGGGSYMFGVEESEVGYELNHEMRPYLEKYKISVGDYPVSGVRSDHISFEDAEIPNINFTQIGIQSVIHSSGDQAKTLDAEQIDLLADCVSEYLCDDSTLVWD